MIEIGTKISNYEILEKLGEGAQGWVYKVRWKTRLGEKTGALKLLTNRHLKDILKEVSNWAKVSQHSNILTFINADEDNGRFFILSELASNGDLDRWIKINKANGSISKSLELMLGVLDGLSHLHQNEVIHRDIKPSNILLNGNVPLLADFGLARGLNFAQSSNLGGTIFYMSPEQIDFYFSHKIDSKYERIEADDLWAIAVTFQQMLTGEVPFDSPDNIRNCNRKLLPPKVPQLIQDFLEKALSKDISNRFQSAEEMSYYLKDITVSFDQKVDENSETQLRTDETSENQLKADEYNEFDITQAVSGFDLTQAATIDSFDDRNTDKLISFGEALKYNFETKADQKYFTEENDNLENKEKSLEVTVPSGKSQKVVLIGGLAGIFGLFIIGIGMIYLPGILSKKTTNQIININSKNQMEETKNIPDSNESANVNLNSTPSPANESNQLNVSNTNTITNSNSSEVSLETPKPERKVSPTPQSSPSISPKVSPTFVNPVSTPKKTPTPYKPSPTKTPTPNVRCILTDSC